MNRTEKQKVVEELRAGLMKSDVAVFTRFTGLKVHELQELRRGLKKISVDYHVVKNTLLRRAMEGTDVALLRDRISGPLALAVGRGDIVPLAKALVEYMRDHPKLEIEVGIAGGRVLVAEEIRKAATLPAKEELVAKLMFLLQSPVSRILSVMKEIPAKLVRTMDEIRKLKEGQGQTAVS